MLQEVEGPSIGDFVHARGQRWRLAAVTRYADCQACELRGADLQNRGARRVLLTPFDRLEALPPPARFERVSLEQALLALRTAIASRAVVGGLRAAARASVSILPYQLEPALAVLDGATRVLLADEVGLGKTIEAALVLAELRARGEAHRALIAAPLGVCGQWRDELAGRFGIEATVVDAAVLRHLSSLFTADSPPWQRVSTAIVSMDFVKQVEVLQGLAGARWDLLVVDEAHLAATARERSAAIERLARCSTRVLLLTATPHSGDSAAFSALCRVGRLENEGPILVFRRTRRALGLGGSRRTLVARVRLSPAERRLHRALDAYTSNVWHQVGGNADGLPALRGEGPGGRNARLAMVVLRKRAASGPSPLLASLERRLVLLPHQDEGDPTTQLVLPLADDEAGADEAPGSVLAAPGLSDSRAERDVLRRLVALARRAVPVDAKLAALRRLIRRAKQPALVFTEYRDTLEGLETALSADTSVVTLHGGMDIFERQDSVRSFVTGRADVLLATDAAAHGLNLQARARLVIDFELPWNPVRIEQRVGRLDRIGQTRKVHAVHLVAGRTERRVLALLVDKMERASAALGDAGSERLARLGEWVVAQAVFDGRCPKGQPVPSMPMGADGRLCASYQQAAVDEAARLPRCRALPGPWSALAEGRICVCETEAAAGGTVALLSADVVTRRGTVVEQVFVALRLGLRLSREQAEALAAGSRTDPLYRAIACKAAEVVEQRRRFLASRCRRRTLGPLARETIFLARLCATANEPAQYGLFDSREATAHSALLQQKASLVEAHREAVVSLEASAHLESCGDPALVLLLVEPVGWSR